jgi:hypothetical protein
MITIRWATHAVKFYETWEGFYRVEYTAGLPQWGEISGELLGTKVPHLLFERNYKSKGAAIQVVQALLPGDEEINQFQSSLRLQDRHAERYAEFTGP